MSLRTAVGRGEKKKTTKKILPSSISAKVKGALIMCCTHVFFPFCFLLTVFNVLSMLFLPLGGLCSAHTRHCLQGLLTVSQETLCSMGCTCTTLPRRPIHPHQLGSTHTLSVAQRCSQSPSKSTGNISGELDQIPTFPFTTFYVVFIAVSSIYLMAPPYEITQQEFLLYSNIWRLNNESCRHSFIKYKVALSAVQPWHFAEWCTICNVITQKMCCLGDNNCHLCLEYNALLSLSMTSQTHTKKVLL